MRILLLIFTGFLISTGVNAQTLRGVVTDGETTKPLYPVSVVNLTNREQTVTDEMGNFAISAAAGDEIAFSFIGYHTTQRLATPGAELSLMMFPLSVQMPEYVLHPGYTPFQRDSAEQATLYSTELNKKAIKVGFSNANGGGFTGLIGGPVQKMSKSYKRNKKFKAAFQSDMEQKFIDTRYSQKLVTALTGFTGDTMVVFMNSYPMDYDFARAATDLEIKMWIRNNYREYLKPRKRDNLKN